jgi:RNA polymerase sigma-70 factor (ECF subfamily)
MPKSSDPNCSQRGTNWPTAATRWTIVLAARGDAREAQNALAQLCETYWYPLYAFVRRQGRNPHDAQDLTQGFFAKLLEKGWLDDVDRNKGRFRSFLLASMRHFLANERDHAQAQKRGGGHSILSLDKDNAESRYAMEPVDNATPEKIFDRRWALTLLEQVLARLRTEFSAAGKSALFDELKSTLSGQPSPLAAIGKRLGMSEGAAKVAAHRLRQRYRELIRSEVAQTVTDDKEVDEELRDLMSALSA